MVNQIFRGMGYGTQLLFLILFSFVGLMLGNIISGVLIGIIDGGESLLNTGEASLTAIRVGQVVTTIFWLFLSSLLYLYLFQQDAGKFLKIEMPKGVLPILLTIFLIIVVQPIVGFVGHLNQSIVFPESLAPIESLFRYMEEMASKMVEKMVSDKSVIGIVLNILIISVFAAVVEEIFFRGCLQQIIGKIAKNIHIAVWVSAVIFSAVHLEFYGFFPRILLGALLGYLYVFTSNLWIPIIAHFTNNFMAIVIQIIYFGTPEYDNIEKFDMETAFWLLPGSLILCAIGFIILIRYTKKKKCDRTSI